MVGQWAPLALPVYRPTNQLDDSRFGRILINLKGSDAALLTERARKASAVPPRCVLRINFTANWLERSRKRRTQMLYLYPLILVTHRKGGCKVARAIRAIKPRIFALRGGRASIDDHGLDCCPKQIAVKTTLQPLELMWPSSRGVT